MILEVLNLSLGQTGLIALWVISLLQGFSKLAVRSHLSYPPHISKQRWGKLSRL